MAEAVCGALCMVAGLENEPPVCFEDPGHDGPHRGELALCGGDEKAEVRWWS